MSVHLRHSIPHLNISLSSAMLAFDMASRDFILTGESGGASSEIREVLMACSISECNFTTTVVRTQLPNKR